MASALCTKPRFIYTHIPKTGGTSFMFPKSPVYMYLRPNIRLMKGHGYLSNFIEKHGSDYFKFSIVRNPYDRFISLWKVRASEMSLLDFIHSIQCGNKWYVLEPQFRWISQNGKLLTDHIVRFENYEDGINQVLEKLGIPKVKLPHLRKTNRESGYRQYYNEESRYFVTKTYFEDIKYFNYLF